MTKIKSITGNVRLSSSGPNDVFIELEDGQKIGLTIYREENPDGVDADSVVIGEGNDDPECVNPFVDIFVW